jgi:hypothetical protein
MRDQFSYFDNQAESQRIYLEALKALNQDSVIA